MIYRLFITLGTLCLLASCQQQNILQGDKFDRGTSLTYMSENMIIPAWENYDNETASLVLAKTSFLSNPSPLSLMELRQQFEASWLAWQDVSVYDIGKAEELKVRNFTNIYPANVELIESNISRGESDLTLPSTYTAQGFPALDYLLFGMESEENIVSALSQENTANYMSVLVDKLNMMSSLVVQDWKTSYKNEFINNDGSSASSSYDKVVNDYLMYYEKYLRAGKVGIPAGVFSTSILPGNAESYYNKTISKELFVRGFTSVKNFYNGKSYNSDTYGASISSYIKYIQDLNTLSDINEPINNNWDKVTNQLSTISEDFSSQVEIDNVKMLELFDALQLNVILLKVDMMQMLNIQVDFIDADGD